MAFFIYEDITNGFFLAKLERRTAILRELNSLSQNGINENADLKPTYEQLVAELNSYRPSQPIIVQVLTSTPAKAFFSSSLLGFFFVLIGLIYQGLTRKSGKSLVGFGLFLMPLGGVIAIIFALYFRSTLVGGLAGAFAQVVFTTGVIIHYKGSVKPEGASKTGAGSRRQKR